MSVSFLILYSLLVRYATNSLIVRYKSPRPTSLNRFSIDYTVTPYIARLKYVIRKNKLETKIYLCRSTTPRGSGRYHHGAIDDRHGSQYYSENLSRDVKKGKHENNLAGKHDGSVSPLGYKIDPVTQKYIIDEEKAHCVRKAFRMAIEGETYKSIANTINAMSARTRFGQPYKVASIHFEGGAVN